MLKDAVHEGELLSPTALRLSPPHECVKRVELPFVVPGLALDTHCPERAFESAGIVEQRIARANRDEKTG